MSTHPLHDKILGSSQTPPQWQIGFRFNPILSDLETTGEKDIEATHWALIFFTHDEFGKPFSYRLELRTDDQDKISFPQVSFNECIEAHPVATYTGWLDDFKHIVLIHPMRLKKIKYSPCFNNCQHFAAAFLIHLDAFATEKSQDGRKFTVIDWPRYYHVMKVLKKDESNIQQVPNTILHHAAAGAVCVVAAGAITGTLGLAIPVAAAGVVGAQVTFKHKKKKWTALTSYDDPREGNGLPITAPPFEADELGFGITKATRKSLNFSKAYVNASSAASNTAWRALYGKEPDFVYHPAFLKS